MAVIKVTLSLLKKQKAYAVTIFLLALIVSLMLASVLTVMHKSGNLHDEAIKNANVPDLVIAIWTETYDPELPAILTSQGHTVREGVTFFTDRKNTFLSGVASREDLLVFPYMPEIYEYRVKSHAKGTFTLNEGEIMFPLFYERSFSLGRVEKREKCTK